VGAKSRFSSLFGSGLATPVETSRINRDADKKLDGLTKQIAALKTRPAEKSRVNKDTHDALDELSKRLAALKKDVGSR